MDKDQLESALDEHRAELDDLRKQVGVLAQGKIEVTIELRHAKADVDRLVTQNNRLRHKISQTEKVLEMVRAGYER